MEKTLKTAETIGSTELTGFWNHWNCHIIIDPVKKQAAYTNPEIKDALTQSAEVKLYSKIL